MADSPGQTYSTLKKMMTDLSDDVRFCLFPRRLSPFHSIFLLIIFKPQDENAFSDNIDDDALDVDSLHIASDAGVLFFSFSFFFL